MKTVWGFLNSNHWYIISFILLFCVIVWIYGCESLVSSMLEPNKLVNRNGLENEIRYLIGKADNLKVSLDRQDSFKQQLLDAANVISQGGNINPSGLLNLAASIGGISFGLSQRQKLNDSKKKQPTAA